MYRPISNPPNPWAGPLVEYLGPAPPARLEVFEEQARSIVVRNESDDIPFTYSVNPYRGCQHACAYCYARTGHRYLDWGAGTDFDTKIVVKTNAAELLERRLGSRSWRGDWLAFSGVTDPYQPLEASYGLTRACLEVCLRHRTAVSIITKAALVRRDVELLAGLKRAAGAHVHLSIPFLDESICRAIEPLAPPPRLRLAAIESLAAAGIPVGVALAPILPGLNDAEIPAILERAREAGASSAFLILARLPGDVRPVFEERLRSALPLRAARVLAGIEDARAGQSRAQRSAFGTRMSGAGPRWQAIERLFDLHCRRLGLANGEESALEVLPPRPSSTPKMQQRELFPESP